MTHADFAKALLGFSIVGTCVIFVIADLLNKLHLFNPDWPPHARFHNAMQGTTLVLVSLVSLAALRESLTWPRAELAAVAPVSFWVGLFVAWGVPGTSVFASEALERRGIPWNIILAAIFILISGGGLWAAYPGQ